MPATTTNLFLLQDLQDASRTGQLADSDLQALQAVADWIKTYVVKPHKDLGRAGTVCPFVPGSLERNVLWLAPEQIADRGEPDVVQRAADLDPGLVPALLALVEPVERGGPESPLRWTTKPTRALAAELTARGPRVSAGHRR